MLPLHMQALPPARRFLIELVAINTHAECMTQDDLDASSYRQLPEPRAHTIQFATRPETTAKYAKLGEHCLDRHLAILWNGELLATPLVVSKLPGFGSVECSSANHAESMLRMLSNPLPARLLCLGAEPAPK